MGRKAVITTCAPLVAALAVAMAVVAAACTSTSTSVTAPSADKCQVSASGAPASFTATGGSGTVSVIAARECVWSVASNVAWVTISGNANGQGNATLPFTVAANPAPAARNGTISIGAESVSLSQAGAPCRFALSRGNDTIGASGGRLSVDVSTPSGCSWTATSNVGWLTIVSGASGTTSATVSLSIASNAGGARVGQLNVAGQIYTVNQQAAAAPPAPAPTPSPPPAPGPPSPPAPPPAPSPAPHEASFFGTVTHVTGKCPNLTFLVGGSIVITDKNTTFNDLSCGDVAKGGLTVSGSGVTDSSGAIHAGVVRKGDDR